MNVLKTADLLVIIGTSTGGPRALSKVIPTLRGDLPATVLVVQHMPAGFTRSLASRLDQIAALKVQEAVQGDLLINGRVLLAPGGHHMLVGEDGRVLLNREQPLHGVRPAVDVTITSAVRHYGRSIIGVILTGMGCDGTNGARLIRQAGGYVIAEDETTSIVWGMPRSVIEAGVANEVRPLDDIGKAIERAIQSALSIYRDTRPGAGVEGK